MTNGNEGQQCCPAAVVKALLEHCDQQAVGRNCEKIVTTRSRSEKWRILGSPDVPPPPSTKKIFSFPVY